MRTVTLAASLTLWGCSRIECGAGTTEIDKACVPDEAMTGSTDTPTGTTGTGTPADQPTLDDVLAALPACTPHEVAGGLDFLAGCVDAGCVGDTLSELETAYGEAADCRVWTFTTDVFCDWSNGVGTSFPDEDADGVADATAPADYLSVDLPYAGTDDQGLGLDLGMGCFVDALGRPDSAEFEWTAGGKWALTSARFYASGVYANDRFGTGYSIEPDGQVENLFITGPF